MAQIPVYLDETLKQIVEQVAAQQERSVSFLVRKWIKEGLERLQHQSEPQSSQERRPPINESG
ncbi:MAG: hypothetical protein KJ077_24720 [Anaerolineae bacterium]|nr:hypothetical protein [Anaerolineae bacterium]